MSNITARILQNALVFALFMSVSLTLHGAPKNNKLDAGFAPAEFIVCDSPDQANLDTDLDSLDGVIALREIQPLPLAFFFHYESRFLATAYSNANPRAPPVI